MTRAKWGLMAVIVLCFFVLDALFLRAAGVAGRWKELLLIYVSAGLLTAGFWFVDGQAGSRKRGTMLPGRVWASIIRPCRR